MNIISWIITAIIIILITSGCAFADYDYYNSYQPDDYGANDSNYNYIQDQQQQRQQEFQQQMQQQQQWQHQQDQIYQNTLQQNRNLRRR